MTVLLMFHTHTHIYNVYIYICVLFKLTAGMLYIDKLANMYQTPKQMWIISDKDFI